MSTWIWGLVLLAAVWAAHWGAERLARPLKKLRRQWGFTAAAGGSFIGLAAASPEIGINVASAAQVLLASAGLSVLALGAYFTVRSTENLVIAFGIQPIVGGLFITAPMAALPEIFAVWSVARSGQVTSATTSVIGDHVVTMTLAFLPLALVGLPIGDLQLFPVNLSFVFLVPAAYAAMIYFGHEKHGFTRWQVVTLDGIYAAYLAVMLFWVLNVL